jgi:hypothetical protein
VVGVENNWRTYSNEILMWEVQLRGRPGDPAVRRWERAVLDAGEAHAVYRVQETSQYMEPRYRRDHDGYLGDVLDARPEILTPSGEPARLLFSLDPVATARLAYIDTRGRLREEEVAYLSALPEVRTHLANQKIKPPLEIMAGTDDDTTWATVSSFSTIWLPWQPNHGIDGDLPDDTLLDNRALAARHTPRLNAFLADIAAAAQEAGGWLRLDRTETSRDYLPFVDDHGVRLDRPALS